MKNILVILMIFTVQICVAQVDTTKAVEKAVYFAEKQPEFPGGKKAFFTFFEECIEYPKEALKNGIEGQMMVRFIIEKDGSLTDLKVLRKLGSGCDEEAIRILKQSPKWSPGLIGGKAVRVRMMIPLDFNLPSN